MQTKNRIHITIYILILTLSTLYRHEVFSQEPKPFFGLPDGARARLGKGIIYDVKYSVDGRQLAVATSNGIWLYDAVNFQPHHLLTNTRASVDQLVFSPDGERLAGLDMRGNVNLWNSRTGEHQYELVAEDLLVAEDQLVERDQHIHKHLLHKNDVQVIGITPDAKLLVTVDRIGYIRHWSLDTGKILHEIDKTKELNRGVRSYAVSPVNLLFAFGTPFINNANKVVLWDLVSGEHKHKLEIGELWSADRLVFSPDGTTLASSGIFGGVSLWNTESWKKTHTIAGKFGGSGSIAFSPESSLFAVDQNFNSIVIYQTSTAAQKQILKGHSDTIQAIFFSPDMRSMASGSRDGTLRVWDIATGKNRHIEKEHFGGFSYFALSPDGKFIVTPSDDSYMCLWDTATGKLLKTYNKGRQTLVSDVAFSPDGRTITKTSRNGTIRLLDRNKIRRGKMLEVNRKGVMCIDYSPDGNTVAMGCGDMTVQVWDANIQEKKRTLREHKDGFKADNDGIKDAVYSPNSKTITTVGYDGKIRSWDVDTGERKPDIKPQIKDIMCVAYSPDGNTLAIVDQRGTIHLLDTSTSMVKAHFVQPQLIVSSIAYHPDGEKLAVGYSQGKINILDATTGAVLQTFTGGDTSVFQLEFAAFSTTLASLDRQGQLLLWEIE